MTAPRAIGVALIALIAVCGRAGAAEPARPGAWLSLGVLAGSSLPDRGLADYQWDTAPHLAWGAQALARAGRFETGLRLWRTRTTQEITDVASPTLNGTRVELVTRARLAERWGSALHATAGVGRLHLAYDPDRVEVPTGLGTETVELAAVNEWTGGGGIAITRPLAARVRAGLEVEHRWFGMDTAHRAGNTIEYRRESFGEWNARLELAWLHGGR